MARARRVAQAASSRSRLRQGTGQRGTGRGGARRRRGVRGHRGRVAAGGVRGAPATHHGRRVGPDLTTSRTRRTPDAEGLGPRPTSRQSHACPIRGLTVARVAGTTGFQVPRTTRPRWMPKSWREVATPPTIAQERHASGRRPLELDEGVECDERSSSEGSCWVDDRIGPTRVERVAARPRRQRHATRPGSPARWAAVCVPARSSNVEQPSSVADSRRGASHLP